MRVAESRVLVTLIALAVVILVPTVSGVSSTAPWVALAAVTVAAGLAAVHASRPAALVALTGLALALGFLAPMDDGGTAARWLALATLPAVVPLAGLTLVGGRPAVWLLASGALVAGPIRTLVYDPFLDPACQSCRDLPTVLALPPEAAAWLAIAGGVATTGGIVAGLRRTESRLPLAGLALVGLWSLSGSFDVRGSVPLAALAAALLAACGATLLLARTLVTRTQLQRLAAAVESGTAPQGSLRRTLGDASLILDFAVGPHEWVDADGRPSDGPGKRHVTTLVLADGEVVARVHHVPDSGRADLLAASLTPELRLAIEHARLTAQLESRVRTLQESRARVVEASDETRRRLERDLHDGAQQELLALGFDLRRAQAAAPQDECLAQCVKEVTWALGDLRALASGVHPALLTAAGLTPALEQAGSRYGHTVRTARLPQRRFAPVVERTAYLLVVDMAAVGPVEVTGAVAGGSLKFRVSGAPLPPGSVVPERVAALGGTLVQTPDWTEVTMPCA